MHKKIANYKRTKQKIDASRCNMKQKGNSRKLTSGQKIFSLKKKTKCNGDAPFVDGKERD